MRRTIRLTSKTNLFFPLMWLLSIHAFCQKGPDSVANIPVNYQESNVPPYDLPEVLRMENGQVVSSPQMWWEKRRPELLHLFETQQFGTIPSQTASGFQVFEESTAALDGTAIRKQVTLYLTEDSSSHTADLVIYTPVEATHPVPLFLQIGFSPNSLAVENPAIRVGTIRSREGELIPASEGRSFGFFPVKKFLEKGIGVAFIYYGDIEPDFPQGIHYGIRGHYLEAGKTWPDPDEWGTISAWSWGLSGVMDYLETDPMVRADKVALFGVSRLGKTVLWTGARDPRFSMIIASCSGEGGAALSRREFGETTKHMVDSSRYFYQFAGNRANYKQDISSSPIDAHQLISLIAPRPLLLQTGDTDYWSDPKGEFEAALAASPVYRLLGKEGLQTSEWPAAGIPLFQDLGYYMHQGGHGTVPSDYDVFIDFMKMHFN